MVFPPPKYCKMIRELWIELETPLPESWEPQPSMSARHAFTFLFAPASTTSKHSPRVESEYSTVLAVLAQRRTWQRHFPNLQTLGLSVHITAPSPFVHNSGFSSFASSGFASFDRFLPNPRQTYSCYGLQLDAAVAALEYEPAQIKAKHYHVHVRCEGCRKDTRTLARLPPNISWTCACEVRFEAVLRKLLGDETSAADHEGRIGLIFGSSP
jgi:hypothetical protein